MKSRPYIYQITFIKTGQKYIGSRTGRLCNPDELWVSYFTSSNVVKALIKKYGTDSFIVDYKIEYSSKEEAAEKERQLLIENNASKSDDFLNLCNSGGYNYGKYNRLLEEGVLISSVKGMKYINDGVKEKLWDKTLPVPSGFKYGRLNFVAANKGKIAYNNGEFNMWLNTDEKIPDGFIRGHLQNNNHSRGKTIYNDGIRNYYLKDDQTVPDGFQKGRIEKNPLIGKQAINDGINIRYVEANDKIPKGWKKGIIVGGTTGKISITDGIVNKFISPDDEIPENFTIGFHRVVKKPHPRANMGKIYITNGIINKIINPDEPFPSGFRRGMTKKPWKKRS
jgi:hypothetical protein